VRENETGKTVEKTGEDCGRALSARNCNRGVKLKRSNGSMTQADEGRSAGGSDRLKDGY